MTLKCLSCWETLVTWHSPSIGPCHWGRKVLKKQKRTVLATGLISKFLLSASHGFLIGCQALSISFTFNSTGTYQAHPHPHGYGYMAEIMYRHNLNLSMIKSKSQREDTLCRLVFVALFCFVFVSMTHYRVIWEAGTSVEKMHPPDWCGRGQPTVSLWCHSWAGGPSL